MRHFPWDAAYRNQLDFEADCQRCFSESHQSPEVIALKDEDLGGEEFEVSVSQLVRHMRSAHSFTPCSVQGRTLTGKIGLYDVESRHFTST